MGEPRAADRAAVLHPFSSSTSHQELGGHALQVCLSPVPQHHWADLQEECVAEGLQLPARCGADAGAGQRRGGLLPAVRVQVRGAQHHHHQGDHHHLLVGGGGTAALHGIPGAGGPSDPEARCLYPAPAQRGGERGRSLLGRGTHPVWRESQHGAGAGGGRPAALEAPGAGAEEDGFRPPQDAELDPCTTFQETGQLRRLRQTPVVFAGELSPSLIYRLRREKQTKTLASGFVPLPFTSRPRGS
ncbi:hypothetical protein Q9966_012896 [Columba livia]|nr:hypothetical protein Q9966_012896 [Columba livia]